jgi:nitronate monooxygenase
LGLPSTYWKFELLNTVASKALMKTLSPLQIGTHTARYPIIQALDRAARSDVENGLVFAGTKAGRSERMIPVAELMAELTTIGSV